MKSVEKKRNVQKKYREELRKQKDDKQSTFSVVIIISIFVIFIVLNSLIKSF